MLLRSIVRVCALLSLAIAGATHARELLVNPSFEAPVTPANGNNFYAAIADWTIIDVTPARAQPFNVIRPHAGYANNPTSTPTGGGAQYLDVNNASGTIRQTITLVSDGMIDIGGWFSVRDVAQALGGLAINIRALDGTLVATASTGFTAADPIGLWKRAALANIPLAAGSYIFEATIPNHANADLMSAVFKPAVTVAKTGAAFSDPLNGTTAPKLIPGAVAEYTIAANTPPDYSLSPDTFVLTDPTPANAALVVADIGGGERGPAAFAAGTSTLTYSFAGLASTSDNIEFSSDGGSSWAYTPVPDANGVDAKVTTVRLRPQGAMAARSTVTFRLRYRIR